MQMLTRGHRRVYDTQVIVKVKMPLVFFFIRVVHFSNCIGDNGDRANILIAFKNLFIQNYWGNFTQLGTKHP